MNANYQELDNKKIASGTQDTKKLSRSLKRGGRLQEVLITGLCLGKF